MFKVEDGGTSYLSISYSDIENRINSIPVSTNLSVSFGSGNIDQDPMFCNSLNKDYRLSDDSVCRFSSNTGSVIGAYENTCNQPLALDDNNKNILLNFHLEQNFPNPFNPSTTIRFIVPEKKKTKLIVYNISGQVVRVLMNDVVEPGFYNFIWNGKDEKSRMVQSGMYIYTLISGSLVQSKKMFLVK